MLIDDDEKRENVSVENSLMKKVKIKGWAKNIGRGQKKLTLNLPS